MFTMSLSALWTFVTDRFGFGLSLAISSLLFLGRHQVKAVLRNFLTSSGVMLASSVQ